MKKTMKNILNNVIVAFVALALTFASTSCKKPNDDPQPSNPNTGGGSGTTNTAPTLTASAVPASATAPATVTITATASDADGSISTVQFVKDGDIEMQDVSAPFEYVLSSLSAGTYTYTVKAIDNDGAFTTATVTFTINASGGTTNTAPTFTGTAVTVVSDGSAKVVNIASLVSDADGNTISIESISPMTGVSNINGTQFTVTPSNNVFAGALSYTVTITDGTDNTNSTITVNVGTSNQINTYNLLSSRFGTGLVGIVGTTTFNAGTITTTGTQPSGGFFNVAASAGTYNYRILSGGNIVFTVGASTVEYSVQSASGALVLTNVANSSKIYTFY